MKQFITLFPDGKKEYACLETGSMPDGKCGEKYLINLYPGVRGQVVEGFGGAFNESAAYVYSLTPEKEKRALL